MSVYECSFLVFKPHFLVTLYVWAIESSVSLDGVILCLLLNEVLSVTLQPFPVLSVSVALGVSLPP